MALRAALARFETTMSAAWSAAFAGLRPGASDRRLGLLRRAIAPFQLPTQVECLYRWREGGDRGVFGGWRMRPIDELIEWYRFGVDSLDASRTWLPVFEDQIVNIVTLDVPGHAPSDESVWYGHTHDVPLCRMFDSIAALLHVVCDASAAGVLAQDAGRLGIVDRDVLNSVDDLSWTAFRLARSPGSYRWPNPPPGSTLSKAIETSWPAAWRAGIAGGGQGQPDH